MERKEYIKNTIEKFITSNHEERLDQCTFGVEVETQGDGVNGYDFWDIVYENLDRENYMDEDEYNKDINDWVRDFIYNNKLSTILEYLCPHSVTPYKPNYTWKSVSRWNGGTHTMGSHSFAILKIKTIINEVRIIEHRALRLGFDIKDQDFKLKLCNKYFNLKELYDIDSKYCGYNIEQEAQGHINDSDYYYSEGHIRDNHPDLFSNLSISVENTEVVSDQSVSGVEVRTVGGLDSRVFEETSENIFESIENSDYYIDKNCSAHVHIKLGDIDHYYGDGRLHGAIMEYLIFNLDRLPKSVLSRLDRGGNRWISPSFDDGKYQWVRFHPQKTIEFRLFGNIDNTKDLLTCQKLALEALAYGYQVRFNDYSRALDNYYLRDLARAI